MRRRHLPLLSLVALLLGLAVPAGASAAQAPGVQAHLLWGGVSSAEMDRQLDDAKAAGAQVVRVDVGWQTVEEAGKGRWSAWYLSEMDAVVAKAQARGIRLLFTLLYSPCWASSAPDSVKQNCSPGWVGRGVSKYPPKNVSDYADALAFLAARYRGRVDAWEVWNEPNLKGFWNSANAAADYVQLIKAAYPAAKAADPATTVVGGVLSEADVPFAQALYANGIKGSLDAFSMHPYSHDFSPLTALTGTAVRSSFISGIPAIHDVMAANGDAAPMWLTEFGWSTSTVRNSDPWYNGVDESVQADYLRKAYAQMAAWDYVKVGIWFNLVNWNTNPTDHDANFGLLRTDHSQKPAYAAYQAAAADLAAGTAVPPVAAPTPPTTPPPAPAPAPTPTPTPAPAPSPTPTRPTRKPKGPTAKAASVKTTAAPATRTLDARTTCRSGRVHVRGAAPSGSLVRVELFRKQTSRGQTAAKRLYRRTVRAANGRFSVRTPLGSTGCGYRAVARSVSRV